LEDVPIRGINPPYIMTTNEGTPNPRNISEFINVFRRSYPTWKIHSFNGTIIFQIPTKDIT